MKHIEALLNLKNSPLCTDILKPRKITCQVPYPRDVELHSTEFNVPQLQAIKGSAEAVQRARMVPKIVLIQGPPGTGKTHTLVGIVKEIYRSWSPWDPSNLPKILICAPSNGAVDEIASRLFAVRKFMERDLPAGRQGQSLRLVRVGQDEQVRKDVQHITLDKLVSSNLMKPSPLDSKVKELERHAEKLDIEISTLRYKGRQRESDEKTIELENVHREIEKTRRQLQFENGTDDSQKKMKRNEILEKADIILTTLNSCRAAIMDQVFNSPKGVGFHCVIIDEASQCSEPELLMPLYYTSISKMILIGDPMQLPATIKSKKGQDAGYGRSFFERVFHFFGGYNDPNNVVHMLSEQFRMHPDICSFPSREFYDGRLRSAPNAGQLRDGKFPLKPFTILDVKGTFEDVNNVKNVHNRGEADFIANICKMLQLYVRRGTTIGIITGYQGQKKAIESCLRPLKITCIAIDVNTIDGFQGQERDVIIFSTVRSTEGGGGTIGFMSSHQRTNVALTRAKYALIVCVSKRSMEKNELWRRIITAAESRNCLQGIMSTADVPIIAESLLFSDAELQAK